MLNIAICDDDKVFCDYLKNIIKNLCSRQNISTEITLFTDGENLCKTLGNNILYDLIFLDIELVKINGIDVARYIREDLKNQSMQIVYISAKEEYVMELFKARPLNFLLKPIEPLKVEECIKDYIEKYQIQLQYFQFESNKSYIKLDLNNIIYFESSLRKIFINTNRQQYVMYGKLSNLIEEKSLKNFWYLHKSFLVNPNYIQKYSYNEVILTTNKSIPISRSRRDIIRQQVLAKGGIL